MKQCSECGGRGEVMGMEIRQHGRYHMQWDICPSCGGSGFSPEPPPARLVMQTRLFDEPLMIAIEPTWATAAFHPGGHTMVTMPRRSAPDTETQDRIAEHQAEQQRRLLHQAEARDLRWNPSTSTTTSSSA